MKREDFYPGLIVENFGAICVFEEFHPRHGWPILKILRCRVNGVEQGGAGQRYMADPDRCSLDLPPSLELTHFEDGKKGKEEKPEPQKSKGHLQFSQDGKYEYYVRGQQIDRCEVSAPVMPDGYRCGRYYFQLFMKDEPAVREGMNKGWA